MIKTKVLLLACILVMSIFSVSYAMPNGYVREGRINISEYVNVRQGPSTNTAIVGRLYPSQVVKVYDINEDGWYRVDYNGTKAYMYAEYLDTYTVTRNKRIGYYKTYFNFNNTNRNHNIGLATKNISVKILPGRNFKWSEIIGPASKAQGYVLGNVIIDNQMAKDYGGGVCQVSSTLYNTALDAGMEIIERHSHGLPVTYVPPGRDATVSYGFLDFIFKNTKPYPIQIIGFMGKGFVEVEIYEAGKVQENTTGRKQGLSVWTKKPKKNWNYLIVESNVGQNPSVYVR